MLAGLRQGLALLAALIGQHPYGSRVPRFSLSAAILVVVVLFVFVILLRLFRGPREPRGIRGLLATRAARSIIFATSVLVVAAMKLPRVVAVAVIMAINVGLYWYALLVHQRRNQHQHPRSDRGSPPDASPP
jgi:amino acid transporter